MQDSVVTTFGNCGSNVTPLITLSGNDTVVRNNIFNNGCTIYSMRSVVRQVEAYQQHAHVENVLEGTLAGCSIHEAAPLVSSRCVVRCARYLSLSFFLSFVLSLFLCFADVHYIF